MICKHVRCCTARLSNILLRISSQYPLARGAVIASASCIQTTHRILLQVYELGFTDADHDENAQDVCSLVGLTKHHCKYEADLGRKVDHNDQIGSQRHQQLSQQFSWHPPKSTSVVTLIDRLGGRLSTSNLGHRHTERLSRRYKPPS